MTRFFLFLSSQFALPSSLRSVSFPTIYFSLFSFLLHLFYCNLISSPLYCDHQQFAFFSFHKPPFFGHFIFSFSSRRFHYLLLPFGCFLPLSFLFFITRGLPFLPPPLRSISLPFAHFFSYISPRPLSLHFQYTLSLILLFLSQCMPLLLIKG